MNVESVDRNVFTPLSKLRLSVYQFSLKSPMLYNVLGKAPIPNFMKKRQTNNRCVLYVRSSFLLRKKRLKISDVISVKDL